jgi:hypothetical protein
VRRVSALLLFTLGYALMALFEPATSALPALATFVSGGALLVRPRECAAPSARIAPRALAEGRRDDSSERVSRR